MWVFLNDAFLSAVEHRDDADLLCVRARLRGDLETVFPDQAARVTETPNADYRFRVIVKRERFMQAMIEEVGRIDYTNFKSSVPDHDRHDAYLRVWGVMHAEQLRRYGDPFARYDDRTADIFDDAFAAEGISPS